MKPATEKQEAVLAFCRIYEEQNQRFPSLQVIGDAMGFHPAAAKGHLERLAKKGYMVKRGRHWVLADSATIKGRAIALLRKVLAERWVTEPTIGEIEALLKEVDAETQA